jgi:hypothetical protein
MTKKRRVRFAHPEASPEDMNLNRSSNHSCTRWEEQQAEECCSSTTQYQPDRFLPPRIPRRRESEEIPLDFLMNDSDHEDEDVPQHLLEEKEYHEPLPIIREVTASKPTLSHDEHDNILLEASRYYDTLGCDPLKALLTSPICIFDGETESVGDQTIRSSTRHDAREIKLEKRHHHDRHHPYRDPRKSSSYADHGIQRKGLKTTFSSSDGVTRCFFTREY